MLKKMALLALCRGIIAPVQGKENVEQTAQRLTHEEECLIANLDFLENFEMLDALEVLDSEVVFEEAFWSEENHEKKDPQ